MPHNPERDQDRESAPQLHHHACGNLFGCGEEQGTGVFREDIKRAAFTPRTADRLLHMDEMNQEQLDGYMTARGRSRRQMLRASGFMGTLAAIGPWFTKIANAATSMDPKEGTGSTGRAVQKEDEGHVHVVESNDKTVQLGVYDTNLEPVAKIDPATRSAIPTRGRTS